MPTVKQPSGQRTSETRNKEYSTRIFMYIFIRADSSYISLYYIIKTAANRETMFTTIKCIDGQTFQIKV